MVAGWPSPSESPTTRPPKYWPWDWPKLVHECQSVFPRVTRTAQSTACVMKVILDLQNDFGGFAKSKDWFPCALLS